MDVDLVLSSGFLAFGRHAGFLRAVEESGARVRALTGTSSGSVCAALFAAGHSAERITAFFARQNHLLSLGRPNGAFWTGLMRMDAFADMLRPLLPARFEDLPMPLGVGVVTPGGTSRLLTTGPLVESVAASCAMPGLFRGVDVEGTRYSDGGAVDRLGLAVHRAWRPGTRVLAHWVERTAGKDVEPDLSNVTLVKTPRSGARFWNLGDVTAQAEQARVITLDVFSRAGVTLSAG